MSNYKLEVENTEKLNEDISSIFFNIKDKLLNDKIPVSEMNNFYDLEEMIVNDEIIPRSFENSINWVVNGEGGKISAKSESIIHGEFIHNGRAYFILQQDNILYLIEITESRVAETVHKITDFRRVGTKSIYEHNGKLYFSGKWDKNTLDIDTKTLSDTAEIQSRNGVGFSYKDHVIIARRIQESNNLGWIEYYIRDKETLSIQKYIKGGAVTGYLQDVVQVGEHGGKITFLIMANVSLGNDYIYFTSDLDMSTMTYEHRVRDVVKNGSFFINNYKVYNYNSTALVIHDLLTNTKFNINTGFGISTYNNCASAENTIINGQKCIQVIENGAIYNTEKEEFEKNLILDGFTGSLIRGNKLLTFDGREVGEPFREHISRIVK